MTDPTLADLSAQIREGFKHDERIRAVENQQAAMATVIQQMPEMRVEFVSALKELKTELRPRSPWPAVAACTGVFMAMMAVFAVLYQK